MHTNAHRSSLKKLLLFATCLASAAQSRAQSDKPVLPASPSQVLATRPWEFGPVLQGGVGVGDRSDFHFFSAGVHAGKVLTPQLLPGPFRGQFEYAAELYPLWQAYTPAPHLQTVTYSQDGDTVTTQVPFGGGTYTGLSITPIILRWDLAAHGRLAPWVQGAGGLIWTNHKFPPDYLVTKGTPGGTSVFNFTPQFGIGLNYFIKPHQSISFAANAIHISSASLGDHNPGVNASVQFQLGYSWWK